MITATAGHRLEPRSYQTVTNHSLLWCFSMGIRSFLSKPNHKIDRVQSATLGHVAYPIEVQKKKICLKRVLIKYIMNEKLSCEEDRQQHKKRTLRWDSLRSRTTKKGPNRKEQRFFETSSKELSGWCVNPSLIVFPPFFSLFYFFVFNKFAHSACMCVCVCVSVCTGMECICVASHSRYHVTEFGDGGGDDDDL